MAKTTKTKTRVKSKKRAQKTARKPKQAVVEERDSIYFLKLVLYIVLGTIWLKFSDPIIVGGIPLAGVPVGLLIGLLIASHDKLQIDRKIEYAVIIVMTVISYFLPAGIIL